MDIINYLAIGEDLAVGPELVAGLYLVAIGLFILKGFALYKAARLRERGWFWIMLIVNVFGILNGYYLYTRRNRKV